MTIYLPIAEIPVNVFFVLLMGGGVGLLSGLFGVGGGFLMTPLLIFYGVPPAVAVATEANQIVAASASGVLAHWRRGNVDFRMGAVLIPLTGANVLGWATSKTCSHCGAACYRDSHERKQLERNRYYWRLLISGQTPGRDKAA